MRFENNYLDLLTVAYEFIIELDCCSIKQLKIYCEF